MDVQKKWIVITGAAGGIGMACAKALKNENLIVTDYSDQQVDATVAELARQGITVKGISCDITNNDDIQRLTQFVQQHGTFKTLIHSAGVSGTITDLKKVYQIDLVATESLTNAFHELAVEGSVAILVSSMMAYMVPANPSYDDALANPGAADSFDIVSGFVNNDADEMYNFAKRGVQLLVQKYADKWGKHGARIVSVSPGVIETPMALKAMEEHAERMEFIKKATPLQRNGRPKDVANLIKFLASDSAGFITGTDILIDGGVIHNLKKMQ